MQPVDPDDPRKPNVKIAASIRAAILSGELEPGSRLPAVSELAEFFSVAAGTIHTAIRTLREEGFVRSKTGSGNYVRDQPSIPVPPEDEHPLSGAATFLFEMGHLKHLSRAGWLLLGIPQPESVAEHSFRVAVIGLTLAAIEGADVGRTTALCLMHDAHETRIGDVPSVGRAYVDTAEPEAITAHQTSGMPHEAAKVFQALTAEYEATETTESRLAHDADKIETLMQAIEYQAQGHDAQAWRETSLTALRTEAGRELARAIGSTDPQWWSAFARSYHELRATSRGRVAGRQADKAADAAELPSPKPAMELSSTASSAWQDCSHRAFSRSDRWGCGPCAGPALESPDPLRFDLELGASLPYRQTLNVRCLAFISSGTVSRAERRTFG